MSHPELAFDRTQIRAGTRICVAVSGGSDSVGLLCGVHAANTAHTGSLGVGLSAVHVHHGLRGDEADADAEFVTALCVRLDVPLTLRRVSVRERQQSTGETLEEAARALRYGVFEDVLRLGADDLLTAHTLDDQAETVLMKLLRGAWLEGLSGIHPVLPQRGMSGKRILRPLLGVSRAEIVAYLGWIGQEWREDSSNADPSHTRNRIRHHILPLLHQENPSLDHTLANLALLAREEEEHRQPEIDRLLPQILLPGTPVRGGGRSVATVAVSPSIAIDIERLRLLDASTRRRVLRSAARSLSLADAVAPRLSFEETDRLLALCGLRIDATVSSASTAVLRLGGGVTARRSPRELRLSLEGKANTTK